MPPTPQQIAQVLTAAADLIEPAGAWTQGCSARDSDGRAVRPNNSAARCWCMVGAMCKVVSYDHALGALASKAVAQVIGTQWLSGWSDVPERTQPEVVAALRTAARTVLEAH